MRRTRAIVTSLLAASVATAGIGVGIGAGAVAAGSKGNPIKASASATAGFAPRSVTVKPGAVVYFKNSDGNTHNAAARKTGRLPGFRIGDKNGNPTSRSWSGKAPLVKGTYAYACEVHSFMKGTLVVK